MDPKYARELLALSKHSTDGDPRAFLAGARSKDKVVEGLGQEFVEEATTAEYEGREYLEAENAEEIGGPFVETSADVEFAHGTDASNPKGSTREPFPTT